MQETVPAAGWQVQHSIPAAAAAADCGTGEFSATASEEMVSNGLVTVMSTATQMVATAGSNPRQASMLQVHLGCLNIFLHPTQTSIPYHVMHPLSTETVGSLCRSLTCRCYGALVPSSHLLAFKLAPLLLSFSPNSLCRSLACGYYRVCSRLLQSNPNETFATGPMPFAV